MTLQSKIAWPVAKFLNRNASVKDSPRNEVFFAIRNGTVKKLVNYVRARFHYRAKHETLSSYPYILRVEPASTCNLKCPLCPTGLGLGTRPRHLMSEALFSSILNSVGDYVFYTVLYAWGEPLLNKHLSRLIAIAENLGVGTELSTNLSVPLSDKAIDDLIKSGLGWLVASIDGVTQKTYETYRKGGNLALVLSNLKRIVARKKALKSKTPFLEWQFIPFSYNEAEMEKAVAMTKELGLDGIRFKPARIDKTSQVSVGGDVANGLNKYWLPKSKRLGHRLDQQQNAYHPFHCVFPWSFLTVHPDGGVAPCCETYLPEHDVAQWQENKFSQLWNSDSYRRIRRVTLGRAASDDDVKIPCFNCKVFTKPEQKTKPYIQLRNRRNPESFKQFKKNPAKNFKGSDYGI